MPGRRGRKEKSANSTEGLWPNFSLYLEQNHENDHHIKFEAAPCPLCIRLIGLAALCAMTTSALLLSGNDLFVANALDTGGLVGE